MNIHSTDVVTLEAENCTGCRACEIACSFHHERVFSQSLSSIRVRELPQRKGFDISFFLKAKENHIPCNGCAGLKVPFCIKYCTPLMRNELSELVKRVAFTESPEGEK